MTKENLAKLMKVHIRPYLLTKGFTYNGFVQESYSIEKKSIDNFYALGRYLVRLGGFELDFPSNSMEVTKVNDMLNSVLQKHALKRDLMTILNYANDAKPLKMRQEVSNLIIEDEETFLNWKEKFIEYWEEIVEPFFKKYLRIEALNEKINELSKDSLSYWFGGYPYFKKLIIMKWANNPLYSSYEKEFLDHHNSIKDIDNGKYLNYHLAALDLHKKLETTLNPFD